MWIRDLFDPGSGIEKFGSGIRHIHPRSATLMKIERNFPFHIVITKRSVVLKHITLSSNYYGHSVTREGHKGLICDCLLLSPCLLG
jgi:hypothetical protein